MRRAGGPGHYIRGMARRPGERWQTFAAAAIATAAVTVTVLALVPGRSPGRAHRPASAPPRPGAGVADRPASEPAPADYVAAAESSVRVHAAEGGSLVLPADEGALGLPAGALATDAEIRAVLLRRAGDPAPAVDLQPDGLQLSRPARLELPVPSGFGGDEVEIVVHEGRRGWVPEGDQSFEPETGRLVARIAHFSLRRVRIRPGMAFADNGHAVRGVFFLESDPANTYERFIDGRWKSVGRQTTAYRDLMKMGRLGRHDLIASGRLRAIAATGAAGPEGATAERLSDELRVVVLAADAREGASGWVRLVRLDDAGERTAFTTVARVLRDDAPSAAGGPRIARLSRAALEALGFTWDADFGVAAGGERTWVRAGSSRLAYVPVALEPWEPGRAALD